MIIAVCDPKGIAIEAIKTILYHDKGLSDRISRIYEFWNMEQLLDASRDSSFDCIVFPNYCNSHNSRSTKIAVKVLKNVFDFLALMLVFLLNL